MSAADMFKRAMATRFSSTQYVDGAGAATYTAPDGTVTSGLTVLLNESRGETVKSLQERLEYEVRVCEIIVQQADVTPEVGGLFTVGSDVWVVVQPSAPVGTAVWSCGCKLSEVHSTGASRTEELLR